MSCDSDDTLPSYTDCTRGRSRDAATIRLSLKLPPTAIGILDDILQLGKDGDGDASEVRRGGIVERPLLARVGVERTTREGILVGDVDEAAAIKVADADLYARPR